jgi:hypothetical protein
MNKKLTLGIPVGIVSIAIIVFVAGYGNVGLFLEENSFVLSSGEEIIYSIKGGEIQNMEFVEDSNSLFIYLLPYSDGSIEITVPLNFFYKHHDPDSVFFMVLFEGEEQPYEITDTENTKTVSFDFNKDIDKIEITGVIIR